ncbi:hypothetical protein [Borrelia recurrentis]|uniref:Uncharacterized protein n=1 Tax=Borrelia recurrentis (strain A1) TaxID=412418 RepID=B5RRH2_BORRA|nr:hypothetical protein BRE_361 [Borrelia recurrentis A1]
MLKINSLKTKRIIMTLIIAMQTIASTLILLALYKLTSNTIFINNSSIKFLIAFIIFSPELCIAILTIQYILYDQLKILSNLINITKSLQIIMNILLATLGLALELFKTYQPWLFTFLEIIIITYVIFNLVILILLKFKDKITE